MVYRFLPDDSGVVAAEDARAGLESFLGLHYPASDIPKQARELYRRNWIRSIPDIDYTAAPLVPDRNARVAGPIDMSHCALRSVSSIHVEYLRNMGVRASMSASIVVQDRLWGMLVLHHYSPRHVPADLRIACEMFAQIFSLHVATKEQAEISARHLEARGARETLLGTLADAEDIGQVLASWDLLGYVGAAGAAVYLDGVLRCVGQTPSVEQTEALFRWLNTINQPVYVTDRLAAEFPPAAEFPALASGLLAVAVSREPRDYVLWFRPEFGRTVRWAGDPSKSVKVGPLGARLTPRGSFAEWLEETRLRCAPWSDFDREAAEALRVILLECILRGVDEVRRRRAYAAAQSMAEELERRVAQRTEQLRSACFGARGGRGARAAPDRPGPARRSGPDSRRCTHPADGARRGRPRRSADGRGRGRRADRSGVQLDPLAGDAAGARRLARARAGAGTRLAQRGNGANLRRRGRRRG